MQPNVQYALEAIHPKLLKKYALNSTNLLLLSTVIRAVLPCTTFPLQCIESSTLAAPAHNLTVHCLLASKFPKAPSLQV